MFELLERQMFGQERHYTMRAREDLGAPQAMPPTSRQVSARIRRNEEAWALHANRANGFGAGEASDPEAA